MIIAVSYKDNEIFEHFGHAEMFAIYKTNDDNTEILSKEIVEVKETGHQAVADLMDSLNVDAVIVGNIGVHARAALAAYGIVAFAGFCGNSDDAAELLMHGQLPFLFHQQFHASASRSRCTMICSRFASISSV